MNLSELKLEAIRIIKAKPEIKSEITELYFLAESEIEEGGSVEHECSLAYNDMIEMEKGTNDFARGGKTSSATMPKNVFDVLSKNIAESYVGKKVKPKFQSEYGKTYSAQEASEVGDKVAAKIFRQRKNKMANGGMMAKGGKIREFDDVLVISKNKLGMVEAIAGETYFISTPFGESFEATADDLRKVNSFAQGGAMEHMIFKGDKVLAIHKNMLIVESNFGLINIIDLSTEPLARRIGVKSTRGKDTLLAAKRHIDYLASRKPKTMAVGGSLQGHGFEVGDLIVEDLGGYIRVTSEDGKDFFITLKTGDRETEAPESLKIIDSEIIDLNNETKLQDLWIKNNQEGRILRLGNIELHASGPGRIHRIYKNGSDWGKFTLQGNVWFVEPLDGKDFFVEFIDNIVARVKADSRTNLPGDKLGDEVVDLAQFYEEGGKIEMSVQQIAEIVIDEIKDTIANDDEVESAYYEVKDFYNSVGRSYDNQKFIEVVAIVQNWMQANKVGDEFYEEGGNVPKVFDVPAQFLDSKGQRKNDRKTIRELTDFVLELPQTKEIYFNEQLGDYTPSRKKLHAEIINKFKKEVVCINNDKPIAIFMGGSPASGKSSFLRKYSPFLLKEEILKIDADEIRAMLPEYEGWNACQTHLETKDIVNILLSNKNIGIPCDFDIIYDGTMNSVKSYIPLMDILRERGYKIFIVFMDNVPKDVIIKRALDRYKSSGRFVPLEVIEDFFSKGKTAFNQLKNDVDGYMLVDGSSTDYRIIEQGGIKLPRDRKYAKLGTKIRASEIPMSYKKGGLSKLY